MPKSKSNQKKGKSKPVQPIAPAPPPPEPVQVPVAPPPTGLQVVYPDLEIIEYSTASPKGPLDVAWCKDVMWWETEKEYQKRMVAEEFAKGNTAAKAEHFLFGDGVRLTNGMVQPIHCRNLADEKVVCWNNAHNRPFDEKWCEALADTILHGRWAGPHTVPGETVNGETIRISRYGRVLSGQHQMSGCILAGEKLAKARADGVDSPDDPKYPVWVKHGEPFIESVVIRGLSEDPRILMTIDYVKPRTASDVFYTSPVFKASAPVARKELCRMLASAVDLLWTRTDAKGYRTHPEIVGFLDRHPRVLRCVEHLFAENAPTPKGGREVSKLHLSPGNCAAIMFLQGCGSEKTTDYSDDYRNENPPTENNLDWSCWDQSEEFWTLLANGADFDLVRTALGLLVASAPANDNNQGQGGNEQEKLAILASAWGRWRDHTGGGAVFDDADLEPDGILSLHYSDVTPVVLKNGVLTGGKNLPDGEINLIEVADFYGIDCPAVSGRGSTSSGPPMPPPPTGEEYERLKEEALARRGHGKK